MLDLLKEIFKSDAGSFGGVASIFLLAFWFVYFVTKKITVFETKAAKTEELNAKIEAYNTKIDTKFDRIDTKYETIIGDIHIIKAFIEVMNTRNNPLAKMKSPVSLTEKGIEISSDIKADELVDKYWINVSVQIEENLTNDICNPYDIQVASFKVGDAFAENLNKDELEIVKLSAFNSGLDLDSYGLLFGVIIRDKYLKSKGFKSSDVDDYAPNKS